jgi:hypothetical protein
MTVVLAIVGIFVVFPLLFAVFAPRDPNIKILNLGQLKHAKEWQPVWHDKCCMCGARATRTDRIKIRTVEAQVGSALAPSNLTSVHDFLVGYCAAHKDGFRFAYPPGFGYAKKLDQCLIAIRNPDYLRDFLQLNGR